MVGNNPPPSHPSILWISTSVSYILIYLLYFFAIDNVDFQKETLSSKASPHGILMETYKQIQHEAAPPSQSKQSNKFSLVYEHLTRFHQE